MTVEITKMQKTEVPVEFQEEEGCVAFQLIKVVIDFFGSKREDVLDTKILHDGRQAVKMGRKGIGFELKESYFDLAKANLKAVVSQKNQVGLFDAVQ